MSVAAYLRALGTGHSPPGKVDLRAIHELGRLRADLGRLGGLLKLWLTDRAGEGTEAAECRPGAGGDRAAPGRG